MRVEGAGDVEVVGDEELEPEAAIILGSGWGGRGDGGEVGATKPISLTASDMKSMDHPRGEASSCTRQDSDVYIFALGNLEQISSESVVVILRQGIELLGQIERDDGGAVLVLEQDVFCIHDWIGMMYQSDGLRVFEVTTL